jgi:hypothetical protein
VFFAIDGEGQASDPSPDLHAYVGTTLQNTNSGVHVGGTNTSIRRCSDPYYANVFPGGQTAPAAGRDRKMPAFRRRPSVNST